MTLSGWEPVRWPRSRASMSAMSSAESSKPKMSRFSRILVRGACLRDGDVAQLQLPPQNDLGRAHLVLGGEAPDDGILQDLPAAQRAPCLGEDSQPAVLFPELGLLQPRMQLDLVDGRHHLGCFQQLVQVLRLEVGHADRPYLALAVERFHGPVRFLEQSPLGARPVDQVHVHVFQPEVDHGRVEGPQRRVVAVVVVPHLGGDEEVLARGGRRPRRTRRVLASAANTSTMPRATPDSFPYMAAVSKWRYPGFQGRGHQIGGVFRRNLVKPESQLVDQHAVVQAEPG